MYVVIVPDKHVLGPFQSEEEAIRWAKFNIMWGYYVRPLTQVVTQEAQQAA